MRQSFEGYHCESNMQLLSIDSWYYACTVPFNVLITILYYIIVVLLDLDVHRTWEFNTTQPLRSPTIPFVIYGIPLGCLRLVNLGVYHYLGVNIIGEKLLTFWLLNILLNWVAHISFRGSTDGCELTGDQNTTSSFL